MRSRRFRTGAASTAVVCGVVLATVGAGSAAYAYYAAAGTGTGQARAATMTAPVEVEAGHAGGADPLYPGATAGVRLTVRNPNLFPVRLTSVLASGPATGTGTCRRTGVTFVDQPHLPATAPFLLPAGATRTVELPGAARMSNASDSGCQGAVFAIPVTLTVRSAA